MLQQVSKRLMNAVRADDTVGRYGGEEFLIILSGCSGSMLKERAEQVRSAIGCLAFATSHGAIPVSVSVGVATIANWDKSLSIELYLKQADAA